jgi:hypothetical protein
MGDPKESLLPLCATVQIREFLGELQVSAGSGLQLLSQQNSFMKPQREESRYPWHGERNKKKAFKKMKRALTNTPSLVLPNMINPFFLYGHERLEL